MVTRRRVSVGPGNDYSRDPNFADMTARGVWFSHVYFRGEGLPYLQIAMTHSGRNAGLTLAEINLSFLVDLIRGVQGGKTGYAYVVGSTRTPADAFRHMAQGRFLQARAGRGGAGRRPAGRHRTRPGRPARAHRVRTDPAHGLVRVRRATAVAGAGAGLRSDHSPDLAARPRAGGRRHRGNHPGAPHDRADPRPAGRGVTPRRQRLHSSHRGRNRRRARDARQPVQQHGGATAGILFPPRAQGRGAHPRPRPVGARAQGARGDRARRDVFARSQGRAEPSWSARSNSPRPTAA